MSRELDSIVSDIINGTVEQRVRALDAYREQFKAVVAAAATAVTTDAPMFVADRVMHFAHTVQRSFRPVFDAATDPELKFMCGLVLLMFGSRDSLPWLLAAASTPGPLQYDVTLQLGWLRVPEVRSAILNQLRSLPLKATSTIKECDTISGMLDVWKLTGEPLPEDVRTRLHSADAPMALRAALKQLEL